ncbi:MAG: flagellar basal body-associated FliL family protein [Anaerohalosphaera sp.]|nr:flagellar basal body-associated FliL family protein [Anaerohalosphaera sp.]
MAEKEDTKQDTPKPAKGSGFSIKEYIIIALVVLVCSVAGFGLSTLLAGSDKDQNTDPQETPQAEETESKDNDKESYKTTWFYDLDPVVANLDVPGATRYVRAALTLEISMDLEETEGTELLEYKKPRLINWLTMYLAGLGLEDVRGERNLRRIQTQTMEAFNEELFGDKQPMIQNILLKEFPIQ